MAYVTKDEEELLGQQQAGQQGPEKVLSQGATGPQASGQAAASGVGAPAAGGQAPDRQKGTGWTNLVNYVDANKPQATEMADRVTGNVAQKANDATTAGQTFQTGAQQTIQSATPKANEALLGDLNTNAAKIANDQQKRAELESMKSATYQGPQKANQFEGYQDVSNQVQNVAKSADALEDFEARRKTIGDAYDARDNYTAGESRLDSFLVGQGDAREKLIDARATYGDNSQFTKGWSDLVNSVTGDIGAAQTAAQGVRDQTSKALTDAATSANQTMAAYQKQADDAAKAASKVFSDVATGLKGDEKSRAAAFAKIGLDASTGEWLLNNGYTLQKLVSEAQARKAGDFAKAADVDQYKAIMDLSGGQIDPNLLAKTGASGAAFNTNAAHIKAANEAKALQTAIEARTKAEQARRDAAYKEYADALGSYQAGPSAYSTDPYAHVAALSRLTGIDPVMLAEARDKGVDLSSFLTKGSALNYGDVATAQERASWNSLLGQLGIGVKGFNVADTQDEGAAYGFDAAGLQAAIDAALYRAPIGQGSSAGRPQDTQKVLQREAETQAKIAAAPLASAVGSMKKNPLK